MAVSNEHIQALARGVAKPAMRNMLEDLAKGIRERAAQRVNANDFRLLNLVAESVENINVNKYF